MFPCEGILGTSTWEETTGLTQNAPEGLHITFGLGVCQHSPEKSGGVSVLVVAPDTTRITELMDGLLCTYIVPALLTFCTGMCMVQYLCFCT